MNRTLIWQLAFRYFRGKRSANAVPILSRISMVAIAVCSAAMIIVFSVFNGLETLAKNQYNAFYPDIKITVARGKFFTMDSTGIHAIQHIAGVQYVTPVIEDNVFVNNHEQQKIITLKGIENSYFDVNDMRDSIKEGVDTVSANDITAIVGAHIMNELGSGLNTLSYMMLYYPNPEITNPGLDPLSALRKLKLQPAGVFNVSEEFDNKYILAPISLVQELFDQKGKCSSIEISVETGEVDAVKARLQQKFGAAYKVETRYEQNKTFYLVMSGEKWAIRAILLLVLIIASFNMVGALSMLVLEKQKDIAILRAMGAEDAAIERIFLAEGVLWSLVGGLSGVVLGGSICLLQQKFGLLKFAGNTFLVDAFPVEMQVADFVEVTAIIIVVGLMVAWYPAIRATKAVDPSLKGA